jgi:hypothetical protein
VERFVFCAHAGFEKSRSFWEMWNGGLVNRVVRVRFWSVPANDVPVDRESRENWLFEQWKVVDEFVAAAGESGTLRGGG